MYWQKLGERKESVKDSRESGTLSNDSRRVAFAQEVATDDQEDGSMYAPDQTMRVLIRDVETDTESKDLQLHINVDSLKGNS